MAYIIAQPCTDVKDKSCMQECPVDCIYEGGRQLYIHPEECVDCGACEPVCPVEAIFYEEDVPNDWRPYRAANAEFFETLGSPGGAAALGPLDFDHPVAIAAPSNASADAVPASSNAVPSNAVPSNAAATGAA